MSGDAWLEEIIVRGLAGYTVNAETATTPTSASLQKAIALLLEDTAIPGSLEDGDGSKEGENKPVATTSDGVEYLEMRARSMTLNRKGEE
jgi:hypothetical protein